MLVEVLRHKPVMACFRVSSQDAPLRKSLNALSRVWLGLQVCVREMECKSDVL